MAVVISYWIIFALLLLLAFVIILTNYNLIFKSCKIGNFIRHHITKYFLKRFLLSVLSLYLVAICLFVILYVLSVNNNSIINSNNFNKPIFHNRNFFESLFNYCYNIFPFPKKVCISTNINTTGVYCSDYTYKIINLGYSLSYMKNVSVASIIKERASISFSVGILAFILQCIIGYPLGIYIARKRNKIADKSVNFFYIFIISITDVIYLYLALIFSMLVLRLPISFDTNNYLSYIPPLIPIVLCGSLGIAYWVKKYILLESKKDYVKFAISKGIPEKDVFYKHILRNALIPLIRTIPTSLALCLCGNYLLELTFNIPGIDLTMISAISLNDTYLILGLTLFFSFFSIFSYFFSDLLAYLLDKRISFNNKGGKENE